MCEAVTSGRGSVAGDMRGGRKGKVKGSAGLGREGGAARSHLLFLT